MAVSKLLACVPLFLVVLCVYVSPALAQEPGFISIDCGGAQNLSYTDGNKLRWVSDASFIQAGRRASIRVPFQNISRPLRTLRYFPGRLSKYCYVMPNLTFNQSYLLRATFYYGNYDNRSHPPSFNLLIDGDIWSTVELSTAAPESVLEIHVTSQTTSISVCLARSGADTPFISALELRPLLSGMYEPALQFGYALHTLERLDWGGVSPSAIRYPLDRFDRLWYSQQWTPTLNTSHEIVVGTHSGAPPSKVFQTAITSDSLKNITLGLLQPEPARLYVALFFSELEAIREGERVFDIFLNSYENGSSPWISAVDVFKLNKDQRYHAIEVHSPGLMPLTDGLLLTLSPTKNSTLAPFLAAWEILQASVYPLQDVTESIDVEGLLQIQKDYNLTEWTGDPCLPTNYSWSWLNCSAESPPRITALRLSNQSLKGEISPGIAMMKRLEQISLDNNYLTGVIPDSLSALTNLKTLDLHNNSLSGFIPPSLASITTLQELFLQNNNLSGQIPPTLLQRTQAGRLDFRFGGNAKLTCESGSCSLGAPAPSPLGSPSTPLTPATSSPPPSKSSTSTTRKPPSPTGSSSGSSGGLGKVASIEQGRMFLLTAIAIASINSITSFWWC